MQPNILYFLKYFINLMCEIRPPYHKSNSSRKSSTTSSYQHVQYFRVSKQWYSWLLFGICNVLPLLIHVIKLLCTISDNH